MYTHLYPATKFSLSTLFQVEARDTSLTLIRTSMGASHFHTLTIALSGGGPEWLTIFLYQSSFHVQSTCNITLYTHMGVVSDFFDLLLHWWWHVPLQQIWYVLVNLPSFFIVVQMCFQALLIFPFAVQMYKQASSPISYSKEYKW